MNIKKNCHNFELFKITLETIKNISGCLDISKVPGLDGIPSKV